MRCNALHGAQCFKAFEIAIHVEIEIIHVGWQLGMCFDVLLNTGERKVLRVEGAVFKRLLQGGCDVTADGCGERQPVCSVHKKSLWK